MQVVDAVIVAKEILAITQMYDNMPSEVHIVA
jgi:hypothetical protein